MISINLLPKEIEEYQKFKELIGLIIVGMIVFISLLMVIYFFRVSKFTMLSLELSKIEQKLKELDSVVKEVEQLKAVKSKLEERRQLVERLLSNGLIYPKFMVDLLKVLPDGVWLSNMTTSLIVNPTDIDRKITGIKVSLTCSSYDKFSIADFLSNLENSVKFSDVVLGPINISQQEKYELHNFIVEFNYKVE
ncbi:MAG: PilN domain-containing protein [Endomicrobia bacterium]|nr:PilN domain-containing protein [Endomicrobiia bacterium]